MQLKSEFCPLAAFIEENNIKGVDVEPLKQIQTVSLKGDAEALYSYGMAIHRMISDRSFAPVTARMSWETQEEIMKQAYEQFAAAAERGHPRSMIMTGLYDFYGYTGSHDCHSATLWFRKAQNYLDAGDPELEQLERILESHPEPEQPGVH